MIYMHYGLMARRKPAPLTRQTMYCFALTADTVKSQHIGPVYGVFDTNDGTNTKKSQATFIPRVK